MEFAWTKEQLEYKQAAIRFAQKELTSTVTENDRHERFPREQWDKCADFGLLVCLSRKPTAARKQIFSPQCW